MPEQQQNQKKFNILWLVAIPVLMFGFGFALIPLYDVFCDITGINGKASKTQVFSYDPAKVNIDFDKTVAMSFMVNNSRNMVWDFKADQEKMAIHPGQVRQINYTVYNPMNFDMLARAVPSITPPAAAKALKKIQCFCFDLQELKAKQSKKMSVVFYLDTQQLDSDIKEVTLAYTLFDITSYNQN